ncbi:MAG: hypothetical protein A4E65_02263 [Syntrophorhabdus sp. PtaU1.Bin153]|nr:MAG: hypothetical protein A4E65_02263 [Syntrophorhabdus sp. PtaU1.Bin153]
MASRLYAGTRRFFHYVIAKRNKEGYVLTVYDFKEKVKDEFQINNEVRNGQCFKMA